MAREGGEETSAVGRRSPSGGKRYYGERCGDCGVEFAPAAHRGRADCYAVLPMTSAMGWLGASCSARLVNWAVTDWMTARVTVSGSTSGSSQSCRAWRQAD